jgi:hypothetical protein
MDSIDGGMAGDSRYGYPHFRNPGIRVAMRRTTAIALAALACATGCGGDDAEQPRAEATPAPAGPCPEGTPFVRARDVIGRPPAGYQLLPPARPKRLEAFAEQFERMLGSHRWRGYDAMVLVRRGTAAGAVVLVMNSRERAGPPGDIAAGADDAERDLGLESEPIRVGREEGRIGRTIDGMPLVLGGAGECATLVLLGDTEAQVRHAASLVRQVG